MFDDDHPVILALRQYEIIRPRDLDFIVANGRPYRGVPLPPKVPRWLAGQCMSAAATLERERGWPAVYGFGLMSDVPEVPYPIVHGWNSEDGETAIDATFASPEACHYWAMGREHDARFRRMASGEPRRTGSLGSDLSPGAFARRLERSFGL